MASSQFVKQKHTQRRHIEHLWHPGPGRCDPTPEGDTRLKAGNPQLTPPSSLHGWPKYPLTGSPSLQHPRSTVEPPENAMQEQETMCYRALLDDGYRPLFPISRLPKVSANAEACTSNPEDWQVFSRQLRRWKEFRKWQLDNRKKTVEFSEYLCEQRRQFVRIGEHTEVPALRSLEQALRRRWKDKYDDAETLLSRYAEAEKSLLIDCGFEEPFQLQADPKQQNQRTTFVEYLAFKCFLLGLLVKSAQKLRVRHGQGEAYTDPAELEITPRLSKITGRPRQRQSINDTGLSFYGQEATRRHDGQGQSGSLSMSLQSTQSVSMIYDINTIRSEKEAEIEATIQLEPDSDDELFVSASRLSSKPAQPTTRMSTWNQDSAVTNWISKLPPQSDKHSATFLTTANEKLHGLATIVRSSSSWT
ncbi:hypothetical protein V500_02050 [Pseudogymnoascus sp. VKM F-4518 (FW-2643)]|nr:hypothetical protein V500_02050 [Pseudogymnoascus sp. VKM F-4518 (FW-2643)]